MSGTGTSPPRGFHSWLAANGLTFTAKTGNTSSSNTAANTIANGISRHLQVVEPVPNSQTPTSSEKDRHTKPKSRSVEFVDLTKEDGGEKTVDKSKVECGDEGINSNGLVALSDYFEKKIKALKGYISLTVFNTQWLRQDLLQQSLRSRSTKEKLEDAYIGMPVPPEWKMSFGEWVVAFDLFVAYLRYYKHGDLADRFVIHKEKVFAIKRENVNWPVAFRYDISIRMTVLTFRNKNGKLANPALRDEKVEQEAVRET